MDLIKNFIVLRCSMVVQPYGVPAILILEEALSDIQQAANLTYIHGH